LCIDSEDNVWNTVWSQPFDSNTSGFIFKYNRNGKFIGKYRQGNEVAQGCVVDKKTDDVWVAHSRINETVGHLKNDGTYVGTVSVGHGPTGVAVDFAGKVWATNYNDDSLSRIDPTLNGGVGRVDMNVSLGSGCGPYNYGDMTGNSNLRPPDFGSWTVIYDSGAASRDWGRASAN
jgi:DNA-binding beta-propeller fold protein YncE